MLRILALLAVLGPTFVVAAEKSVDVTLPASDDGLPGQGPLRRYKWFKRLWEDKRSAWANAHVRDHNAVVFLGDSITQGWGARLSTAFPALKVANRGISGDTTRGMLIRLDDDVLVLQPRAVVLLMGTNDLEEGAKPETIASNLRLIVQRLRNYRDDLPIVLCDVFPSSASKKRKAEDIQRINQLYAEVAKGDPWIFPLDTWTLFADEHGDAKRAEFPDLLHPNDAGYAKWAKALRPIFATLDLVERDAVRLPLEPGYVSLFNGRNLDGWQFRPSTESDKRSAANWQKRSATAPPWPILTESTLFDGRESTTDGRYVVRNGKLVVAIPPERRKIQQFWTQEEFPHDFVLKLEFRATPNADSGIFIRGKQLQCRDYALAGPYKNLKDYRPQDWNEIVIVVRGQSAYCTCNGEVLEEAFEVPATGPIGLEGDRGQIEYRHLRIKTIKPELPRGTPEQSGVSSSGILKFVKALDSIESVHSVMLLRHGTVIAEGWWAPFQSGDPHQLYSLSKSFASTAVGLAISEGKLSLDDRVIDFFPDELPEEPSGNLKSMRVRDLLSMSTGHAPDDLKAFSFTDTEPLTKQFLALPVEHRPGTHFLYNTPATYMCSAIVQSVTGQRIVEYLQPRLFDPLGIAAPIWSDSPQGICHGGFGLNLRTEDIARFGQLLLQRGEWEGRQLVPSVWVEQATGRQVSNGSDPHSDWAQGYGFQFWRCRHGFYRGDGAFGQFCIVMPSLDAVLAVTSGASDMGAVMIAAWEHLVPAMRDAPLRPQQADQRALQELLTGLRLDPVEGKSRSEQAAIHAEKTFVFPENAIDLQRIRFKFGPQGTALHMVDGNGERTIPIGFDEWRRSRVRSFSKLVSRLTPTDDVAIAASGAWTDDDRWRVRLWFHESPFRVDLTFDFADDEVTMEGRQNVGFGPKEKPSLKGRVER